MSCGISSIALGIRMGVPSGRVPLPTPRSRSGCSNRCVHRHARCGFGHDSARTPHRDLPLHAALAGVAVEGYVFRLAIKFRQFVQLIRLSVFSRICSSALIAGTAIAGRAG